MGYITPVTKAEQALAAARTPEETRAVEALAAAAKAWAREQDQFELVVEAGRLYILARRKTTELIEPSIRQGQYGREGNDTVTFLQDYGFTKMQWSRRKKELAPSDDDINDYLDDCIEKRTEPTTYGLLRYVTDPHVYHNSGDNEWYTPPAYTDAARLVMGTIDLDPASSEMANRTVRAETFYTAEQDGLQYSWSGNVWMNPPYASDLIGKFVRKLAEHIKRGDVTQAIVLVNNATETNWFASMIEVASAVVFPTGRVRFMKDDGELGAPLQGQAVIYAGDNPELFLDTFEKFGWGAIL